MYCSLSDFYLSVLHIFIQYVYIRHVTDSRQCERIASLSAKVAMSYWNCIAQSSPNTTTNYMYLNLHWWEVMFLSIIVARNKLQVLRYFNKDGIIYPVAVILLWKGNNFPAATSIMRLCLPITVVCSELVTRKTCTQLFG